MNSATAGRTARIVRNVLLCAALTATGCAHMNHAQSGATVGSLFGATVGALAGSDNGNALPGALIGGAAGAVAGGVLGSVEDAHEERDEALLQRDAAVVQAQHLARANALTNFDLIRLAQSGVSDAVIVNMIQTRGGRFDLTTDSIISLKRSGVSDQVILAAQQAPVIQDLPPVVVAAPRAPDVVFVEPAPPVIIGGWGYHHHYHRRPYHRSRVGVSVGF